MDKKFEALILRHLRKLTIYWRPRDEAMKQARIGRGAYRCARCTDQLTNEPWFKRNEIDLDHAEPVGALYDPPGTWDALIGRLFPPAEGWQVLCKFCHQLKTNLENENRRKAKRRAK